MSIRAIYKAVWSALGPRASLEQWRTELNLSHEGLKRSFWALGASLPLYLICAYAAIRHAQHSDGQVSGQVSELGGGEIPLPAIAIILALYAMTFPVMAYLICQIMGKMSEYRPWVIIRNWANLALTALMALFMGLSLIAIPYMLAAQLTLIAYLATLLLDIRLCQTVLGMEWVWAIFLGCAIAIIGLAMLLTGFSTFA